MASLIGTGDTPPLGEPPPLPGARLRVAPYPDRPESTDSAESMVDTDANAHVAAVWCTLPIEFRAGVAPGEDWRNAVRSAAFAELHRHLSHLSLGDVDFFVHDGAAGMGCLGCEQARRSAAAGGFDPVDGLPTASEALARALRRSPGRRRATVVDMRAWRGPRGELVWRTDGLVLVAIVDGTDHWRASLQAAATLFIDERSTDVSLADVGFDRR